VHVCACGCVCGLIRVCLCVCECVCGCDKHEGETEHAALKLPRYDVYLYCMQYKLFSCGVLLHAIQAFFLQSVASLARTTCCVYPAVTLCQQVQCLCNMFKAGQNRACTV
jgi:hypothetical protein